MTWDTAKKAIDYGLAHSGKDFAVTFYGGEPLLRFDLLRQCVEYVKATAKEVNLSYSMTTNLVLMTPEIAGYLASVEGFSVVCSIDGPKEIHDANRLAINGNGSFDQAVRGLRYLVDAFGERAEDLISLSMVVASTGNQELDRIQDFIDSLGWLPPRVSKLVSHVSVSQQEREEQLH
jgi:uncharacterized protein